MAWNYQKLLGRIKEMCGTQDNFAEQLGINRSSLSQRLNNRLEFTQNEIFKACDILSIPLEEMEDYFFNPKDWKNQTS